MWNAAVIKSITSGQSKLYITVIYSGNSGENSLSTLEVSNAVTATDVRALIIQQVNSMNDIVNSSAVLTTGPVDLTPIPPTPPSNSKFNQSSIQSNLSQLRTLLDAHDLVGRGLASSDPNANALATAVNQGIQYLNTTPGTYK